MGCGCCGQKYKKSNQASVPMVQKKQRVSRSKFHRGIAKGEGAKTPIVSPHQEVGVVVPRVAVPDTTDLSERPVESSIGNTTLSVQFKEREE